MNAPLLEFRDLTVRYGARAVLDGFCGALWEGRILAVVGPNGCGKSTLLKSVFGLVKPDVGGARLMGRLVGEWDRCELVAFAAYQLVGAAGEV